MTVHDWSRVGPGIFHDFHSSWIVTLKSSLNGGVLPDGYYALAEQVAGDTSPDVLALQAPPQPTSVRGERQEGGTAVAQAPPRTSLVARAEKDAYLRRQKSLVIRHSSGDRIVALLEILSPGNKSGRAAYRRFLDKALSALSQGYHLLLIDLLPIGALDPAGLHGALWTELEDAGYRPPADRPLTLASYCAAERVTAYVEPLAVGEALPDMPLFLSPERYVQVPLQQAYDAALDTLPRRWREELEARG